MDRNKEFFKKLSNFLRLDLKNTKIIEKKFEFIITKMGETLISPTTIPEEILIVLNGQLRIKGIKGNEGSVFTIGLVDAPVIIGLSSIFTNEPIEFISAATECECAKIKKKDWDEINNTCELNWYKSNQLSLSEIYHLSTLKALKIDFNPPGNEFRKSISQAFKNSILFNPLIKDDKNKRIFLEDDFVWLIAESSGNLPYGKLLTIKERNKIIDNKTNLRIIGLPIQDENTSFKSLKASKEIIKDNSIKKEIPQENEQDNSRNDNFRFFSSTNDPIGQCVACFQMLGNQLNIPIKKDVIEKILKEITQKTNGEISLSMCAGIAENYELNTQLGKLPKELIKRFEAPAFLNINKGKTIIIFRNNKNEIIVGDPLDGIKKLSHQDFLSSYPEDEKYDVIIFRKTQRTLKKNFGFSWFKPALKKHKKALLDVLIASIFVQIFQLMNPLIIQQIIDKVIGQNGVNTLPVLAALLFIFSIFENTLSAVRSNLFVDTTNRIDISLGEQVIDHLLRLPLSFFDRRPVGELSTRLGELEQIRSFLTGTALTVVLDAIFSIIYIAVMLIYSWVLTIVALLVTPILALLTFGISPIIRRQLRTKAELNAKTQNLLVEVLTGIQTVKAQNMEIKARWRWKERYSKYISESFKNVITSTTTSSIQQFLNQASSLTVLCVGSFLVLKGQLTLGELIAFRIISGYVIAPLLRLSNLYQSIQQTLISFERLGDILNNEQESTAEDKINIPMKKIDGSIKIDDLSFRFGKTGPLIISQINLDILAGQFVAIVGQSGSGKSTLTKLIPRLYEPLNGKILIDDFDIAKVELYSLRSQIGIVPQDTLLFDGTIRENIAIANPDASDDEIINAARIACAHEFIMGLPVGYSTNVGERGGSLSGGQRQRIAIARTILQNPRLLIMDEATSALDYELEKKVSLNIMEKFKDKTVFFITHRLNSITHADKIVVMDKGKIDEQGTHDDLIINKGRYYALFNQQNAAKNLI
tara:strand:- start:1621 stop:4578 length:2958 start_codon:yes stop_codon:yes gene_type:complete